jgi:hypothetical protein
MCHVKVGGAEIKSSPFPMVFGSSGTACLVSVIFVGLSTFIFLFSFSFLFSFFFFFFSFLFFFTFVLDLILFLYLCVSNVVFMLVVSHSLELVSIVKVEGDGVVSAKVSKPSNFSVSTFNASGKPIDISKSDLDIIFGDQLGNEMYAFFFCFFFF